MLQNIMKQMSPLCECGSIGRIYFEPEFQCNVLRLCRQ
jgi:hypothetical protein